MHHQASKYLHAAMLFLGFLSVIAPSVLADTPGAVLLPGSQPERVEVGWEGSFVAGETRLLTVTVYDPSAITELRRLVRSYETVRIVTRQTEPEGWGSVLVVGLMATSWENDDGYFEYCYVDLRRIGNDMWQGSLPIVPTASLTELYVCMKGSHEESMIVGLAIDEIVPITLQIGNTSDTLELIARPSEELENNRIAQLASLEADIRSARDVEGFVDRHVNLGLKWYRLALDWLDWCEVVESPRFSSEVIDPNADAAITMLRDNGVAVMLDLVYWDDRISIYDPPERLYSTAAEIDRYADYVRKVVRHFRGRVDSYSLLNEPNVPDPGQFVDASDYVELVRQVVPVIREEDPEAKVVIGEITPLWGCDELDYLFSIVDSDVLPMVDGIAWHWGGASPEIHGDFYYRYPQLVREIRQTAVTSGFDGELLTEELIFRTSKTPHPSEYTGYGKMPAAKYMTRVALMSLGLDLATGFGLENLEQLPSHVSLIQNLCTVMAGHEAIDIPVAIDIDYDGPVAHCAFRYPNGDRILAVWTDGIAQDEVPSVPATIRFPELAAGRVTGIDVLHGFERELVFKIEEEDTIVRDVLVKDYPILIRFSDVTLGLDYEEIVGDGFHRLGDVNAVVPSGQAGDRDGDGVPDNEDYCPDWPGSKEANGC